GCSDLPAAGTLDDTTTGKPCISPPVRVTVGNTGMPNEFCISTSDSAVDGCMKKAPESNAMLAVMIGDNNVLRSVRTALAVVPVGVTAVTPLVMLAGDTLVTSA